MSLAQMETGLEETDFCSPVSTSPSLKSSPSPPSSAQESTLSSSHDCFPMGASSSLCLDGRTVLDIEQRIVLNLDKKTVMDLKRRIVLDLNQRIIMATRLVTTAYDSVVTTNCINIQPTQRTNTSTIDAWTKRKQDQGYDADVSDMDSVCCGSESNILERLAFNVSYLLL
ncbi:MAG: hypothetical protein BYD32DRAFT_483466 [Podila humilis]|nr:MAG: hypothetical protein BYD32DRAFT_483466 [Podila humilis]